MAMSMRSRGAAAAARRSRHGVRPIYEDFTPTSELKHEEGADILLFRLPGFMKEQIRIIAESKGILKVRGERLIADNKWSRFQEEVAIPEHCNLNEIRAKFEDGILRIIMPKDKQHLLEKEANKSPQHEPEPEPLPSNVNNQSSIHQQPQLPKQDLASTSTLPDNIESMQKTSNYDPQAQSSIPSKDFDEHKGVLENVTRNNGIIRGHDGSNIDNAKEKHGLFGDVGSQGKEAMKRINESYAMSNMKNNLSKKGGVIVRKLDEDRQLLVNMGVAILVIMAIGASISHSLGG